MNNFFIGLSPDTFYSFRVGAENNLGPGPLSPVQVHCQVEVQCLSVYQSLDMFRYPDFSEFYCIFDT